MSRRRMLYSGEEDPYKDIVWDKASIDTGSDTKIVTRTGYCMTPRYGPISGHKLVVKMWHFWGTGTYGDGEGYTNAIGVCYFTSATSRPYNQDLASNINPFTVTVPGNCGWVAVTLRTSKIDDCYVYDKTTGEYLFRGKNIAKDFVPS